MEGPLYSAEQIIIPPSLPTVLKEFTKAAIRTQPDDILVWASSYFEALSKGEAPPVKARYESNSSNSDGGLTKGRLATLHHQIMTDNGKDSVPVNTLNKMWIDVGCTGSKLTEILSLGDFNNENEVQWKKILAIACTSLEQNLSNALKVMCEIMTIDPEGGDARIEFSLFSELYIFLAKIDGDIGETQLQRVLSWLKTESERFDGKVGPREFQHHSCPKLKTKLSS